MKDVLGILEHLGYGEIRPETARSASAPGATDWRPLSEVNGRFGTTDETHILTRKRTAETVEVAALLLAATQGQRGPIDRWADMCPKRPSSSA